VSNQIYPVLPGLTLDVTRDVLPPPVTVLKTPSRRRYVARDATIPLYAYTLKYEFLRVDDAYAELQTLVGFFNLMGGGFDTFLFDDTDDNTATAQIFGVGNGATTTFQLLRSFGGFAEPVTALQATPAAQVFANGSPASSYTISAAGLVTFGTPPAVGVTLTWTGKFYRRCAFSDPKLTTTKFMNRLYSAGKVQIESVLETT
jgi:hypothetical protein